MIERETSFGSLLRTLACASLSLLVFTLPIAASLATSQVFAVNKFAVFIIGNSLLLMFHALLVSMRKFDVDPVSYVKFHRSDCVFGLLVLFLLCAVVSSLIGTAPLRSFLGSDLRHTGLFLWMHLALFALMVQSLQLGAREWRQWIVIPIIAAGLLQVLFACVQRIDPHLLFSTLHTEVFLGRAFGTLGHPTFLGQFLLFPLFLSVSLFPPVRASWKSMCCMAIFLLGILLTGSRASLLGACGGFLVLALWQRRAGHPVPGSIISSLMLGALSMILTILLTIGAIPTLRRDALRSTQTRIALWSVIPAVIARAPFFGVGLENVDRAFLPLLPRALQSLENPRNIPDSSHNIFFDLLIETGFVGVIAFLGVVVSVIVRFVKSERVDETASGVAAALMAIMISWQFGIPAITDLVLAFGCLSMIPMDMWELKRANDVSRRDALVRSVLLVMVALLSIVLVGRIWESFRTLS